MFLLIIIIVMQCQWHMTKTMAVWEELEEEELGGWALT